MKFLVSMGFIVLLNSCTYKEYETTISDLNVCKLISQRKEKHRTYLSRRIFFKANGLDERISNRIQKTLPHIENITINKIKKQTNWNPLNRDKELDEYSLEFYTSSSKCLRCKDLELLFLELKKSKAIDIRWSFDNSPKLALYINKSKECL